MNINKITENMDNSRDMGCIGSMRDDAPVLDAIVEDAMRQPLESNRRLTWDIRSPSAIIFSLPPSNRLAIAAIVRLFCLTRCRYIFIQRRLADANRAANFGDWVCLLAVEIDGQPSLVLIKGFPPGVVSMASVSL
jgi:hypothetical protein